MKAMNSFHKIFVYLVFFIAASAISSCNQDKDDLDPVSVTDTDGNIYQAVKIGNQVWMAENLKTTRFNNGTPIPNVTDNTDWSNLMTPGYSIHGNDETNAAIYGALYNWHAVNNGNLCPEGWHMPSVDEWTVLIDYLGGTLVAGGKLKETGILQDETGYWYDLNTGATNESGFSARGATTRLGSNGLFMTLGLSAYFWTSTELDVNLANTRSLGRETAGVLTSSFNKKNGQSCRCVKD